ncbi:tetratricopeptide repeat protein, partial [Citrobacter portucalensis]
MNKPINLTMLQEANLKFRAGDYESAIQLYKETISQKPELEEIVSANIRLAEIFLAKSDTATQDQPAPSTASSDSRDSTT